MTLDDILDNNPCPAVNPYIVADYLYFRAIGNSAKNAHELACRHFEGGSHVTSQRTNKYRNLSLYGARQVNGNPVFDAHGYRCRWIENIDAAGISLVSSAHIINSRCSLGWYADAYDGVLYSARVLRVTGTRKYLIGYADPENPGSYLIEEHIHTFDPKGAACEQDACNLRDDFLSDLARCADEFTEKFATEAREHDEAWQEARMAAEKASECRSAVREIMSAIKDAYNLADNDEFCEVWEEYRSAMKDFAEKMYWANKFHGISYCDVAS